MAGPESGVEPASVHSMLELLSSKGVIEGGTLCGAGGGGFLAMIASKGKVSSDIESIAEKIEGFDSFTWHSCEVAEAGLRVEVSKDQIMT